MSKQKTSICHLLKLAMCNHKGTGHKVAHNFTTLLNIPLVAWLIYSIFSLRGADYAALTNWITQPCNMIVSILFVVITLLHFTLELEVVFEDYISDLKRRHFVIGLLKAFFAVLGVATIISILKFGM